MILFFLMSFPKWLHSRICIYSNRLCRLALSICMGIIPLFIVLLLTHIWWHCVSNILLIVLYPLINISFFFVTITESIACNIMLFVIILNQDGVVRKRDTLLLEGSRNILILLTHEMIIHNKFSRGQFFSVCRIRGREDWWIWLKVVQRMLAEDDRFIFGVFSQFIDGVEFDDHWDLRSQGRRRRSESNYPGPDLT